MVVGIGQRCYGSVVILQRLWWRSTGPRSSGDRAPASGAGCVGSNPTEGAGEPVRWRRRRTTTCRRHWPPAPRDVNLCRIDPQRDRIRRAAGAAVSDTGTPAPPALVRVVVGVLTFRRPV